MRDNNIISILHVLLTETTLVTKANPSSVRIWDRYRRGPRFVRILDWSNLGPPSGTSALKHRIPYSNTDIQATLKGLAEQSPSIHVISVYCL